MAKGIHISKPLFILASLGCLSLILIIGLSTFLTRSQKCDDSSAPIPTTTNVPTTTNFLPITTTTSFVPTTTNFVPTTTNFVPTTTNFVPTTTNFVPTTTNFVPTTTNFVPTTTNFVPTTTNFVPTTTNFVPTSSPTSISSTTNEPYDENTIRLPKYIKPTNYNLYLKLFFSPTLMKSLKTSEDDSEDRFEGTVLIDFELTESASLIRLHADNTLKILDPIQLTNLATNQLINISEYQHAYAENQFYDIRLDQSLPAGSYKLKMDYHGDFSSSSSLVGFYKTSYYEDGIQKNIVATKFEPIDARKALPCFDEPALKASFELTIEHPEGSKAFSNWPESPKESIANNRFRTKFEKTSPMSTYLFAWTVLPDDFGVEEATTQKGIKIRVMARKAAVEAGLIKFAVEVSKKSIDFFENEYFDEKLKAMPPKSDMIAFPDFSSGAMEHWGLIGYRETSLLYSDQRNSISNKQSVAFTIAHEIAHYWFGNLVTCSWWTDLWLNEAMARFLQFKAINNIYPEWDVENQFLTLYKIPVMYDDGFQTSQPVSVDIQTPNQISSAFSSITYDKGSSLLRMLESTVGPSIFQFGLNNYLKNNEFGASVAADFYNSLQLPPQMVGISPQDYMEQWLLQKNYPIVYVQLSVNSSTSNTIVSFSQDRFLLSEEQLPGLEDNSPYGFKWPIYLQCRAGGAFNTNNNQNDHLSGQTDDFNYFLANKQGSIELGRRYTWIKCNKDFKGFYVTDYPLEMYDAFNALLINNVGGFSVADRANLLHISYSLAYLGTKSYSVPALLTNYLEYWENDYVPWRTFTWHMNKIASLLEFRPSFFELKGFGEYLTEILLRKLDVWDIDNGTHLERLLKINAIDFICRLQDEYCLLNATNFFEKIDVNYFSDPNLVTNSIEPNLRSLVYKYHIQNTYDYEDSFKLFEVYQLTVDPQEKSNILNALAQTRSTWMFDIFLDELLQPYSKIRTQDFFNFVIYVARNPNGRHMAWYFIREYWYEIIAKFGLNSRALANAVKSVCETFADVFLFNEMQEFFSITNPGSGSIQRLQTIDIVIHNYIWVLEREEDLKQSLFIPAKLNKYSNKLKTKYI